MYIWYKKYTVITFKNSFTNYYFFQIHKNFTCQIDFNHEKVLKIISEVNKNNIKFKIPLCFSIYFFNIFTSNYIR